MHCRLTVLVGLLILTGCGGAAGSEDSPEAARPNIILISIDTLRADRLSCYGYRRIQTPAIDGLAAGGVLFEQALTPAPITLPAHASLLTGTLPLFHGVRDNSGFRLPENRTTLAEILAANGYSTGAFVGSFVLASSFGLNQGFEVYDEDFQAKTTGMTQWEISERPAQAVLSAARQWISGQAGASGPFFAWIHLFDPHAPYDPPAAPADPGTDPYDSEVQYVDSQLEQFFTFLREQDLYEISLIVLTADHGEGLGEHNEDTHGLFLYDSTLRVPLIFKLPHGEGAGSRVSVPVSLIDVVPTVLEVVQMARESQAVEVQGSSLAGAWSGGRLDERPVLSETWLPYLNYGWSRQSSLRTGDTKWIHSPRPELYDLQSDPGETRDLFAGQSARAERLEAMRLSLADRYSSSARHEAERQADLQTVERLRALGYAAGTRAPESSYPDESLPDPKDKIDLFNQIWRAQAASQAGDYERSVAILNSVLQIDPDIFMAHSIQALNFLQLNRLPEAIHHLESAARLRPDDAGSRHYLGIAFSQSGRWERAAREFETALQLDPDNPATLNNLATIYVRQGQYDRAAGVFERLAAQDPRDPAVWVNLGVARLMQEDAAEAEESFERALKLDPGIPEVHNNLGLISLQQGRTEQAIHHFETALRLRPDYANARSNLQQAEAQRLGSKQ